MLRLGYPAALPAALLRDFPLEVECLPLPDALDSAVEIDVWIPDPYPTRALKIWPHLRGVKLVLSLMAGTEWIPATVGPHVTICNARGAHNIATAEWVTAAILAMLKYLPFYVEFQQSAQWKRRFEIPAHYAKVTGDARSLYPPVMLEELTGKKLLLVGYGAIGKEIERMLSPFALKITRVARSARDNPTVHAVAELDDLLPGAEIVVLILPCTSESRGLFDRRRLALLQQGALLVNAARGPIVDTGALVDALHAGRVRAVLDVTEPEPLPPDHPLWKCPNLLITPHIGGSSPQFAARSLRTAASELRRYMNNEAMQNVVQVAV